MHGESVADRSDDELGTSTCSIVCAQEPTGAPLQAPLSASSTFATEQPDGNTIRIISVEYQRIEVVDQSCVRVN